MTKNIEPDARPEEATRSFVNLHRHAAPYVAILAVVLGREVEDRVAMLDAGADDCLAVPFDHEELKARVRAARRRRGPAGPAGPAKRASTRDRVSHR
jgi:DNA-binding response OmpR family regulator